MTLEEAYKAEDEAAQALEQAGIRWDQAEAQKLEAEKIAANCRIEFDRATTNLKMARQRVAHILYPNGIK